MVFVLLLLFFAARRGNLDARLLLGPVALSYGATMAYQVQTTLGFAGYDGWEALNRLEQFLTGPFPASARKIADLLMQISILAIVVLRFARTRRDEERHASELEAARVVKQVLVPDEIPAIPGFLIQSVYSPQARWAAIFPRSSPRKMAACSRSSATSAARGCLPR
jgi:hypothetical protein